MDVQAFRLLILLSLLLTENDAEFACKSVRDKCACAKTTTHYELQCPGMDNAAEAIYYTPAEQIRMDCSHHLPDQVLELINQQRNVDEVLDIATLPHLNDDAERIKQFAMNYCVLPENALSEALRQFNVQRIEQLSFVNCTFTPARLTKRYFSEFASDLKMFDLKISLIERIDEDTFDDMRQLNVLSLNNINMPYVKKWFRNLWNLKSLDLSRNNIERIDPEAFHNLSDLIVLHLWSNEITDLPANAFKSLSNLTSLELMRNNLVELPEQLLYDLVNLRKINLSKNKVKSIPSDFFRFNSALDGVRLAENFDLREIPANLFASLSKLNDLRLEYCNLETLNADIFKNNSALISLNINNNKLQQLPNALLNNLRNLEKLFINNNELSELPLGIFDDLHKLRVLDAGFNKLTTLDANLFKNLYNLEELYIEHNNIEQIDLHLFQSCGNLLKLDASFNNLLEIDAFAFTSNFKVKSINLSHNQLHFVENRFANCLDLEELDLSYNKFEELIDELLFTKNNLSKIKLNNNKITSINLIELQSFSKYKLAVHLEGNSLHEINFQGAEIAARDLVAPSNQLPAELYVNDNPLQCDDKVYDLLRYFDLTIDPYVRTMFEIKADKLRCASPDYFKNVLVQSIAPSKVTGMVKECPVGCKCVFRPFDRAYIVDCAMRGLKSAPRINQTLSYRFKRVEVNLENNYIREFPLEGFGYEDVDTLMLSHNLLTNITWLPPKLKLLLLDHNNMSRFDTKLFENMNCSISLHENPWLCDCLALNFSRFVKDYNIIHKDQIRCKSSLKQINILSEEELCTSYTTILALTLTAIAFFITGISVSCGLYYKYNQEIKVWLYAHNMLMWFVTEEDLDKDKQYDAFLSYSHVDENFIIDELVSKLENGPNPYKLCIHTRNWIPGEFIATQVVDSVKNSRRTIVVLSPNFLESVWGKLEFRTAHTNALSEGRTRVIVILYGDIDPKMQLDEEISAYLKTNTYIKWGDPWFWNKLRYALPHRTKPLVENNNRKLQKINLNLDKMDLINGNATPNIGSTPPIGPLLLKQNPLEFKSANCMTTPPAEAEDLAITVTC